MSLCLSRWGFGMNVWMGSSLMEVMFSEWKCLIIVGWVRFVYVLCSVGGILGCCFVSFLRCFL